MADMPCCKHQKNSQKKNGPMLALDCMGVSLSQAATHADVPQPNTSLDIIHFTWADLAAYYHFQPMATQSIRGPPDKDRQARNDLPVLRTTQRLRI